MKKQIVLENVTINYAYINKPDDDGFYRVKLPLNEKQVEALNSLCDEMVGDSFFAAAKGKIAFPISENDGLKSINAKTQFTPVLCDKDCNEDIAAEEFYSGAVCNVSIQLYPYLYEDSRKHIKKYGISASLQALQKIADGKRLDNRMTAKEIFGCANNMLLHEERPF